MRPTETQNTMATTVTAGKGPEMNKDAVEAFEERAWQGRRGAGVAELRQVPRT
jgi:hypothetical protein